MRRLILGTALLVGCGAKRVEAPAPADAERGAAVFAEFCAGCHPGGGRGVGPALDGSVLTRPLLVFQVRRGHGIMPGFHEEQIADRDLDDLVAYVARLQEEGRIRRETTATAADVVETIDVISPPRIEE